MFRPAPLLLRSNSTCHSIGCLTGRRANQLVARKAVLFALKN